MDPNELDAGIEPDALTAEETAILESGGERDIPEPAPIALKRRQTRKRKPPSKALPSKTVPHETFHAEREEHKKTKAELSELREFRLPWTSACAGSRPPSNSQPEGRHAARSQCGCVRRPEMDAGQAARTAEVRNETRQQQEQREERAAPGTAGLDLLAAGRGQLHQGEPRLRQCGQWLSDYRDKQLSALSNADSRFSTPQARNAQIETELKGIIIQAAQQRKSPAQLVYEIAKGYGYAAKPDGALNEGLGSQCPDRPTGQGTICQSHGCCSRLVRWRRNDGRGACQHPEQGNGQAGTATK
jgi:hypothetical protein